MFGKCENAHLQSGNIILLPLKPGFLQEKGTTVCSANTEKSKKVL